MIAIDKRKDNFRFLFVLLGLLFFLCCPPLTAHATQDELKAEAEERKNDPVESNEVEGWPDGPKIGAEAAVLMDVDTGTILYSKNMNGREFPASTTKILTALLAVENCGLEETITVNQSAIDANASDGSNMGLRTGEKLTLEQILYGILINSANEGCNAVAEHISGSMDAFVEKMNERAKELGCTNSHFVTTNGLHNEEHYTSAHDLALIACEFFKHDILCQMSRTPTYVIPETEAHLEHHLKTHNKLYAGMEYEYPYLVGSKTGFTSNSRQCLVSCAEKNGMRLVCVIMKEESPYQFEDTLKLFEYGFSNFNKTSVASFETKFDISQAPFFDSSKDLFGSTAQLLALDKDAVIMLPKDVAFEELDSVITYHRGDGLSPAAEGGNEDFGDITGTYDDSILHENTGGTDDTAIATVDYSYHSVHLGSASILLNKNAILNVEYSALASGEEIPGSTKERIFIDPPKIILSIVAVIAFFAICFFAYVQIVNYKKRKKRKHYRVKKSGNTYGTDERSPAGQKSRMHTMKTGKNAGMKSIRSSGEKSSYSGGRTRPQRISSAKGDNLLSFQEEREHRKVSPPKPKKKRKPTAVEQVLIGAIDAFTDLSEAKRVEQAKEQKRERERRMKQRLREEAEQHRIEGAGSIRTKQGRAEYERKRRMREEQEFYDEEQAYLERLEKRRRLAEQRRRQMEEDD